MPESYEAWKARMEKAHPGWVRTATEEEARAYVSHLWNKLYGAEAQAQSESWEKPNRKNRRRSA